MTHLRENYGSFKLKQNKMRVRAFRVWRINRAVSKYLIMRVYVLV